jgi:hypothetical protein
MGKINITRVLLGGLLAGLVVNVFEFVTNGVVLASQWDAGMKALGRQMPRSAPVAFIVSGFLVGIGAIWLYAAARPRFGPGPQTAALTGLGFWAFGYALPNSGFVALGIFPMRLIVVSTLVGLVELIAASLCGAWFYKEQPLHPS